MKRALFLALQSAWCISNAYAGSDQTYLVATNDLGRIEALTKNLTKSIAAWDGKDLQSALDDIHDPTASTTSYILNATKILKEQPTTFDLTQAFTIGTPTQRLAYAVNASVATLTTRKQEFDDLLINTVVVSDLESLLEASRKFSEVLISYVPGYLEPVADSLNGQIVKSLQQGIDCFNNETSACSTVIADPNRTYELAVKYNAMKPDGSPFY